MHWQVSACVPWMAVSARQANVITSTGNGHVRTQKVASKCLRSSFCCVLICPCSQGLEQKPGAKRAFPYTAQEVSQLCRQRCPRAFRGSTQGLTPVVASAPAVLHPQGWGRHEGMGAVLCLGTWEGER